MKTTKTIKSTVSTVSTQATKSVTTSKSSRVAETLRECADEVAADVRGEVEEFVGRAKSGVLTRLKSVAGKVLAGALTALKAVVRWLRSSDGIMFAGISATVLTLAWMLTGSDGDATVLTAAVLVPGTLGGKHVGGAPLTTELSEQVSPGLLLNEIDSRIIKIRPMATPIDQISRYGGSRLCGSMTVDYYSVDTKEVRSEITESCPGAEVVEDQNDYAIAEVKVKDVGIFDVSETLLVPEVGVADGGSLVLYVTGVSHENKTISVMAVNNVDRNGNPMVPSLRQGLSIVRMGRAAAELDVQTGQFEAAPHRRRNYCQIFKAQVEQSTFMKIANKEVGWTFSDQEEAAIIDMRQGMEKNFIFGAKGLITRPGSSDRVMLTGGIWHQIGKGYVYGEASGGKLTAEDVVSIMRKAFTGHGASARKVLIAGSGFIEALNGLQVNRVISAGESMTKWGLNFTELHSNFGSLYVLHSEMFDQCGHEDDAMVIDPEYLTKYAHVPFRTERLNLRASGVRNTDAIVITEASCLVLRYPNAHLRITRTTDVD